MATFRGWLGALGLMWMAVAATGCASPYAYYGPGGYGPLIPSARTADCGTLASDGCSGGCATDSCDTVGAPCGSCFGSGLLNGSAGCGRMYWGEWAYDPPDACDPCNDCGEWVGPRACPPSGWFRFWQGLSGLRCGNACGGTACSECDVPVKAGCCDGETYSSDVDQSEDATWLEAKAVPASPPRPPVTVARTPRRTGSPSPTSALARDPQSRLVRHRPPVRQ